MSESLKDCPFCGNPADTTLYEEGGWSVGCDTMGCGLIDDSFQTEAKAVAAWNRRAEPVGDIDTDRDKEMFKRGWDAAKADEPVGEQEPVGSNALFDPVERQKSVKRLRSLAEAVREAAKRLPDVPVSAEIVACAGIMGMANWLERVASMLAAPPAAPREPTTPEQDVEGLEKVIGHLAMQTDYWAGQLGEGYVKINAEIAKVLLGTLRARSQQGGER